LLILSGSNAANGNEAQTEVNRLAITNVSIIDATGVPAQHNMTVLIRDGVIMQIGSSTEIDVPEGFEKIRANGNYLIPGLWDMHTHLSKARASAMNVLIANGITTVRDMGGDHEELLDWRRQVRTGERTGPRIFLAGPYLESKSNVDRQRSDSVALRVEPVERTRIPIGSVEDAERVITCLANTEIDFLKIRTYQNPGTLNALGAIAEQHNLDIAGHAFQLSPEQISRLGLRSVEHTLFPPLDDMTRDQRMTVWRRMADEGRHFVPTMAAFSKELFLSRTDIDWFFADMPNRDPRMRYVSRYLYLDWKEQAQERDPEPEPFLLQLYTSMVRNWSEMRTAGVQLMPGSDIAVLGVFAGSSVHEELAYLVSEIGMTPMEAIQSATRAPAKFTGQGNLLGTIETGKLADLVLLRRNPLEDISNTRSIESVVLNGRYFSQDDLENLLKQADAAADHTSNDWVRTPAETDRHQCMPY
jgi:imidazolonepropionase-like amidohydrolase